MKAYLENEIKENEKRTRTHLNIDAASAEYWRGRADAYRDVLRRFCIDEKPDNSGLKVYGMNTIDDKGANCRAVCAAKNKKQAVKILGTTAYHLGKYGSITANPIEVNAAMKLPGEKILIYE
jgi:hypothetical protein